MQILSKPKTYIENADETDSFVRTAYQNDYSNKWPDKRLSIHRPKSSDKYYGQNNNDWRRNYEDDPRYNRELLRGDKTINQKSLEGLPNNFADDYRIRRQKEHLPSVQIEQEAWPSDKEESGNLITLSIYDFFIIDQFIFRPRGRMMAGSPLGVHKRKFEVKKIRKVNFRDHSKKRLAARQ